MVFGKKIVNWINKNVNIKAELVGFISVILVFLSLFAGSLSVITYKYIFLFWIILEALIAYIAGLIAGYAYFSMYGIRIKNNDEIKKK
ncbi:Uncharacterised protein [Candidatus Tiddalikarchaeum anstoanum]|nr:Uncharacterised protein [Candidatus Tiddalikarchaeum anstoanum]